MRLASGQNDLPDRRREILLYGCLLGQVADFVLPHAVDEIDGAAQRLLQAQHRAHQRGFSGAVLAHDAQIVPGVHRKAQMFQDRVGFIAQSQIPTGYQSHYQSFLRGRRSSGGPFRQRLLQHRQVVRHDAKIRRAVRHVPSGDALHGIEDQDLGVPGLGGGHDGLGDAVVVALDGQHGGKAQRVHLARQEHDGLKAGLAFGRAAGECGKVAQIVVVHQIAEGEAVAEQHGVELRSLADGGVLGVQRGQFFDVGVGVGGVAFSVGQVGFTKRDGKGLHQLPGVAQAEPDVLVHLVLVLVLVVALLVFILVIFIPVFVFIVVMLLVFVVFVLHALHDLFHLDVVAHGLNEVHHDHIRVHGLSQRVFHPLVALAAHVDEHIAGGDLHDVLGGGLVAVQIHAIVQQHGNLNVVVIPDYFTHPVIDGEDGGHHAELLLFRKGSAREHECEKHDKCDNARNKLFHGLFLRLYNCYEIENDPRMGIKRQGLSRIIPPAPSKWRRGASTLAFKRFNRLTGLSCRPAYRARAHPPPLPACAIHGPQPARSR